MKNKRTWHKTNGVDGDPLILQPLDGQIQSPYCFFYEKEGKLAISEWGKSYSDHAVAIFHVEDINDAESICSKLISIHTA